MIVAGTGHRPKFLPCLYNENHPWLLELKGKTKNTLELLKVENVITGCALGWDTWLAEVAMELGIKVHCYVPFRGQGGNWPASSKARLDKIIENCHVLLYLSKDYTKDCFLKRDRAMVEDADLMLALWNPEITSGGTYYTVQYAKKQGKKVFNLWNSSYV